MQMDLFSRIGIAWDDTLTDETDNEGSDDEEAVHYLDIPWNDNLSEETDTEGSDGK